MVTGPAHDTTKKKKEGRSVSGWSLKQQQQRGNKKKKTTFLLPLIQIPDPPKPTSNTYNQLCSKQKKKNYAVFYLKKKQPQVQVF